MIWNSYLALNLLGAYTAPMTLPPPDPDAGADLLPGEVPAALFDLAVNRASAALRGVGAASQERALSEWHARTRFARRVPLGWVAQALATRPSVEGPWHWSGGPGGAWQPGRAAFP